jgi:hypothetical protein
MILSTLSLSPHRFALGLYPKSLIPMEIFVHPYIFMILPISSQCGTLVVYPTYNFLSIFVFAMSSLGIEFSSIFIATPSTLDMAKENVELVESAIHIRQQDFKFK